MADSLVLTGKKTVTQHTGSEMTRVNNPRGGDTIQLAKWWITGGNGTVYVACTVFKVEANGAAGYLAIANTSESVNLKIVHDGTFGFTFIKPNEVSRAALFDASMGLVEHYVFPKISGGQVMTVTPAGAAAKPAAVFPVSFTGTTSISGTATEGQTLTATAATFTGGKGTVTASLNFQVSNNGSSGWTNLDTNAGVASGGTATYTLTASEAGKYIRATFKVTDTDGTVTRSSSSTGPVAASFATRVANAEYTYVVTVVDDNGTDVYALNGTNQLAVAMSPNETAVFDFSGVAGAHPLGIFTDASKTTPVTVGVNLGGAGNATLLFQPPIAGTFSYQCINHAAMGGSITVS